ncbi:hypothetical protein C7974DRAFT_45399 [Boeremia exigua]|uniref:uncharacterized protein n=1 Tax=Boeremia exigua TaxID=749465 RepID=UPI001E8E4B2E|nr:uncharacterized protein C7974DRAFT_45399 [Boeremia exigua]KAH6616471.1 hypothetical protein C7974DRAFT_45399 [Boeremia exigua]
MSSHGQISQPATIPLISTATEPNTRRQRVSRIDAIAEHLMPGSCSESAYLQEIVCYCMWLNLIACHVANITPKYFENSTRYPYFAQRINPLLSEIEARLSKELSDEIYQTHAKAHIMEVTKLMDKRQLYKFLEDNRTVRFFKTLIHVQTAFVEDLRNLSDLFWSPMISSLRGTCRISRHNDQRGYSEIYSEIATLNEERLIVLLNLLRALRNAIGVAGESKKINPALLQTLKRQLQMFDSDSLYAQACFLVNWESPQEPCLVQDTSGKWWTVPLTAENDASAPQNAFSAYPHGQNMRSTLTVIVPIMSLLSIFPAVVAWMHGETALGNTHDSNFWQAISNSIMHLLGLLTFVWPTWKHTRLSQLTWSWIWILAGFSAICSVGSIPLYLKVSPTWSFSVSFAAVLAQAVVQLRVINVI